MMEVELFGLFVPQLLLLVIATFVPYWLSRWIFKRAGFYHWIWHPALFDTALYVVLLGLIQTLAKS
jgi:protein AaeX